MNARRQFETSRFSRITASRAVKTSLLICRGITSSVIVLLLGDYASAYFNVLVSTQTDGQYKTPTGSHVPCKTIQACCSDDPKCPKLRLKAYLSICVLQMINYIRQVNVVKLARYYAIMSVCEQQSINRPRRHRCTRRR